MSHLDEGTLTALLDGELAVADRVAAEAHLDTCVECRRLYEETRGFRSEADRLVSAIELPPAAPRAGGDRRAPGPGSTPLWIRLRPLAWAATVVLAVGLGWLADGRHLSRPTIGTLPMDQAASQDVAAPAPVAENTLAAESAASGVSHPPAGSEARLDRPRAAKTATGVVASPGDTTDRRLALQGAARRSADSAPAVAGAVAPAAPAMASEARLGAARAGAPPAGQNRAREEAAAEVDEPSGFRPVSLDDAVRILGGAVRLVDGLEPRRVMVAPGRLVEGADPALPLVRVIYDDPPRRELWLDQQRLRSGDNRPADAAAPLLAGDTLLAADSAPGARQVRWLTPEGFRLQLTGYLPADSLRRLIPRVR